MVGDIGKRTLLRPPDGQGQTAVVPEEQAARASGRMKVSLGSMGEIIAPVGRPWSLVPVLS
jgi:hypothetical protein